MYLVVSREVWETIEDPALRKWLQKKEQWGWCKTDDIDLDNLRKKEVDALEKVLAKHKDLRGVITLLRDITTWRNAQTKQGKAKARTVRQFASLLINFLATVPGHRVYRRSEVDVWLPGYVSEIEYHAPDSHCHTPAFVVMKVVWEQFGGRMEESAVFYEENIRGLRISEALARKHYVPETTVMRRQYKRELKRFHELVPEIGKQCWMHGVGYDDPDGNPGGRHNSWYWSRTNVVKMVRDGQPTRVVVDVFYEEDDTESREERRRERVHVNRWFWDRRKVKYDEDAEDAEDDEEPEPEIPTRPYLVVFDFTKHLRLRAHVTYLNDYEYDTDLAEKLVLPDALKALVHMLVEHREGQFTDIVRGKGGGAVVLLAGPPGVGKTLTAEVFAEASERPLYSIQCSQLGTDAEELEEELLKVFARGKRWNAVILLDEADVYVHERGRDMEQNAIVGVFLRVLEYQDSILFLTTNRPDDVDDAICSRCVARLPYGKPTKAEQRRIWDVLAKTAGVPLPPKVRDQIMQQHDDLTGRDIKNVLKLAHLLRRGQPITAESVTFSRQFQPTGQVVADLIAPSKALMKDLLSDRPKVKAAAQQPPLDPPKAASSCNLRKRVRRGR